MIDSIEVKATYIKTSQVPRIGQRKKMRVNGCVQTMTLNELRAERRHHYGDNEENLFEFDTTETWGKWDGCEGW